MEINERIAALETLLKVTRQSMEEKEIAHQREREAIKADIAALYEKISAPKPTDHFKWLSAVMLGMVVMIKEVRQAVGDIIGRLLP